MNQRIEKVKTHFQENKKTYITAAGCLTVGIVIGIVYTRKNYMFYNENPLLFRGRITDQGGVADGLPTNTQIIEGSHFGSGSNNSVINTINNTMANKPLSYIIQLDGTDRWFISQAETARQLGLSEPDISKHLTQGRPLPNDISLTRIGIAA